MYLVSQAQNRGGDWKILEEPAILLKQYEKMYF